MYTPEMSTAFHSIEPPKNFGVVLADAGDYINIIIDPDEFLSLITSEQEDAVEYINDIKKILEANGAIVQIIREAVNSD
jgi:hypothetical protein